MNDGINPNTPEPDSGEFSPAWWRTTKAMIDRGYRLFCKKRGMDPGAGSMREQISGDAKVGMARRKSSAAE